MAALHSRPGRVVPLVNEAPAPESEDDEEMAIQEHRGEVRGGDRPPQTKTQMAKLPGQPGPVALAGCGGFNLCRWLWWWACRMSCLAARTKIHDVSCFTKTTNSSRQHLLLKQRYVAGPSILFLGWVSVCECECVFSSQAGTWGEGPCAPRHQATRR